MTTAGEQRMYQERLATQSVEFEAAQKTVEVNKEKHEKIRNHLIEIALAIECSHCMEGPALVAFGCGHAFCNRSACASSTLTVCPTCNQAITIRRPADLDDNIRHIFNVVERVQGAGVGTILSEHATKRQEEQRRMTELRDTCANLHSKQAELAKQVMLLHSEKDELKAANKDLRNADTSLRDENGRLQSKQAELAKQVSLLEAEKDELKAANKGLRDTYTSLRDENGRLQSKQAEGTKKASLLEAEKDRLQAAKTNLRDTCASLRDENGRLHSKQTKDAEQTRQIMAEKNLLQANHAILKHTHTKLVWEAAKNLGSLQESIQAQEEQLSALRAKLADAETKETRYLAESKERRESLRQNILQVIDAEEAEEKNSESARRKRIEEGGLCTAAINAVCTLADNNNPHLLPERVGGFKRARLLAEGRADGRES